MEGVAASWNAWRAAPESAHAAQCYVNEATMYAKTLAGSEEARDALSPADLWLHVRATWADVARAALGLVRNSAVDPRHAQMIGYAMPLTQHAWQRRPAVDADAPRV